MVVSGLTSLDVSNFNTSSVISMSYMFSGCSGLTSLTFGKNFNTSSVTSMNYMFASCYKLTSLDLSNFDTSSAIYMSYMFASCYKLTSLDLSNFDMSSVTSMNGMFYYCSGLTSLTFEKNFNTSSVTTMGSIFSYCKGLTSLDLSNFDTSSVTTMNNMFASCTGLTSITFGGNFNTSKVTNMAAMFYCCSGLTSLDVTKFNTSSVTDMGNMFYSCSKLISLDVTKFDTSSVTEMGSMFSSCRGLTSLDVTKFNTSSVTNMGSMFSSCRGLTSLDLSNFDTSSVTNMSDMFYSCGGLRSLDLSNFDTSSVTTMSDMFYSCGGLRSLKLGDCFDKLKNENTYKYLYVLKTIITTRTKEPIAWGTSRSLNNDCILYVLNEGIERKFESGENYATVFGSDSDVPRDDGSTDIYRIRTIMELVGDSEVSVEIGSSYTEQGVTVAGMNANDDGTYTPFGYTVASSIKDRSGNVVSEIDTSRTGTYTVTYKLSDASGEVEGAEISRTVKVTMIHSVANGPVLNTSEMKAVYWNESGDEFETTSFELAQTEEGTIYNTTLYNYNYSFDDDIYEIGKDTYEVDWAVQPRWANAKTTSDGSYWVWIPRYAYKITYYTGNDKKTVSSTKTQYGSIDVIFLKDKSNNEYIDKNGDTQTLPKGYIVHPAFQAMSQEEATEGNRLGKWSEELTGIWVAKYEASQETLSDNGTTWTAASGTNGKTTNAGNTNSTKSRVVSKPSVTSWRSIKQSYIYQNCLKMNETLNTHQMKNSEWGAVAYLTYSVYGRNGNELAVNQCSSYYTGGGPGNGDSKIYNSTYEYNDDFSDEYAYNTSQGKLASTTGNIYGIYDMSGGGCEYTASYVNNGHDNLMTYGNDSENSEDNLVNGSGVTKTIENMKTKQIYLSTTSSGENTKETDYDLNSAIYGDALSEISTNGHNWCSDYMSFPNGSTPFFLHGGYCQDISAAGLFYIFGLSGGTGYNDGFRPVICITSID